MREFVLGVAMIFAVDPSACRGGDAGGKAGPGDAKKESEAPPALQGGAANGGKQDPCGAEALRLGAAKAVPAWTIPTGCTPKGSSGNIIAKSDEELRAILECTAGSGVDFGKQSVLAVGYSLSPAGAGMGAFDDGKVITLVSRQRSPCPGDPLPMPMNTMAWFVLEKGGERTFASATCTIASTCK